MFHVVILYCNGIKYLLDNINYMYKNKSKKCLAERYVYTIFPHHIHDIGYGPLCLLPRFSVSVLIHWHSHWCFCSNCHGCCGDSKVLSNFVLLKKYSLMTNSGIYIVRTSMFFMECMIQASSSANYKIFHLNLYNRLYINLKYTHRMAITSRLQ